MATVPITSRNAYRRTDDYTPGKPRVTLVTEPLQLPLAATSVLIRVHAVSLNYRDANIANGGNPWPVTPHGIPCNDAAGEIIAVGEGVRSLKVGDRVAPIIDTENLTGREATRSWLAADEDGVLADYLVFGEEKLTKLPQHLDWVEACLIPCAGVTAWTAIKDVGVGKSILIQGTGGVAMVALKLARAAGLKVILSSSSDAKLARIKKQFSDDRLPLFTVNYAQNPQWHEEVLKLTDGAGVDLVVEIGGTQSLVKSMKCTRRGGIISQVGYLSKQNLDDLAEFLPLLIDRRIILRGINGGSKLEQEDLCAALSATQTTFKDIIDKVYDFAQADEAIEDIWQARQVGKLVIRIP
ncbi:uncharacterized protein Z520_04925 [Fonsecaea multimorphosa CBS 102226]|uniref:Enoyl reductase (ER) domain-containing protein n=1 Tax=Fonsecaea multimorphosa CBS 102226 TaxID=1442371 RepID=A0A0D2K886_9EURO|nr:uncharacterized protein Z520_04925 [Fonsecaea multimorphosa CBS 102226]KIX99349.1 hypothetical protein Z520_04925 [Fonsecaea multimorphosa CBS 102226]OAL25680.1 hypothetical protein AYO22_04669 [Fonsecaea multimorphosa]